MERFGQYSIADIRDTALVIAAQIAQRNNPDMGKRFYDGVQTFLDALNQPPESKVLGIVAEYALERVGPAFARGQNLFNDEPIVLGRWTKEPGMWTQEAAHTLIPCFSEVIIDPLFRAELVAQIITGASGQKDLVQPELVNQPTDSVVSPQRSKAEDISISAEQIFNEMIAKVQGKTQGNFPEQGLVSTTQITPSVAEESKWELVRATRGYYYSLHSRISFPFRRLLTEPDILRAAISLSRRNYDIGGPQINDDRSQMTIKIADLAVEVHLGYTSQLVLQRARNQRGMEINNHGEAGKNFVFLKGYPRQSEGSDHEKWGFALGDNREGRERFADRLETYLKIRNVLVEALSLNR